MSRVIPVLTVAFITVFAMAQGIVAYNLIA